MERTVKIVPSASGSRWGWHLLQLLGTFIKKLEFLGSSYKMFGSIYHRFFYHRLIQKELLLAGLRPGATVLHLGCGPLPLTALSLAECGYTVEALDNDPSAVESAKRSVREAGLGSFINIKEEEGLQAICLEVDAVWVSLHVIPRDKVLQRAYASLKHGGKLIYRNPRGAAAWLYPRVEARRVTAISPFRQVRQFLGKETVVITKTEEDKQPCVLEKEENKLPKEMLILPQCQES